MEYWNKKIVTAAKKGDKEALKLCLQNDVEIDYQGVLGETALMKAARWGHLEVCRLLIDRGCKIDITDTVWGQTALMKAALNGHLEICQLLIDRGCKIDITGRDGYTALHWAVREGYLQTTRCLVEQRGASPLITTHEVRRERRAETDLPLEYLDCIPTDEILDKLAPQIGQVYFQLGAVIGLSIGTLETIQSNNPRDLAAQNREVLFAWRKDRTVKPTIMVLIQALVNIGKGARCLQEVLKNVDLKTLKESEEVRGEGAIPEEPKNTSEQKPHGKKKKLKKCSIA